MNDVERERGRGKILFFYTIHYSIQRQRSSMNEVNNVAAQIHAQVIIHFPAPYTQALDFESHHQKAILQRKNVLKILIEAAHNDREITV